MKLYKYKIMFVPKGVSLQDELDNFSELGWRLAQSEHDPVANGWKLIFERVLCEDHEVIEKGEDNTPTCRLNGQKCLEREKAENID